MERKVPIFKFSQKNHSIGVEKEINNKIREDFMKRTFSASVVFFATMFVLAALTGFQSGCRSNPTSSTETSAGTYSGTLKLGHMVGTCMSSLFIAHDQGLFADEGLKTELVWTPNPGDAVTMLNSSGLSIWNGPFPSVYLSVAQGADLKIIAGSGKHGLVCLARPELNVKSIDDLIKLKGKGIKVGTQRTSTIELNWYSLISARNMSYADFDMKFFFDTLTPVTAFQNKEIDIIAHVEPYATLISNKYGGVRIGDSVEAWGEGSPDCVVSVKADFLKKYPVTVKKYIRALLRADAYIKEDMTRAVGILDAGKHFKVDKETLAEALPHQPPGVDLRRGLPGLQKAVGDMVKLGYIKSIPSGVVDLSILEEVTKEAVK